MAAPLTVVDLFAGVGGFTLGFLRAAQQGDGLNFSIRALVDSDPAAAYTFKRNCPNIPYWQIDVTRIAGRDLLAVAGLEAAELDFLVGGPPCQGFSPSGKRWLEDARNRLTARFVEIAQEVRPKCVIIENVPTVISAWGKLFDQEIRNAFPGYSVRAWVMNASEFGVPQIRKRAIVVALRNDLGIDDFNLPAGPFDAIQKGVNLDAQRANGLRYVSVEQAIGDLPSLKAGEGVDGGRYTSEPASDYQRDRRGGSVAIFNHVARSHSEKFLRKLSVIEPSRRNGDFPEKDRFSDKYYSQAYARLHAKGIGFTITSHFRNPGSGRFTHYRDNRSITVREAARLQSFDDWFVFHGYETDQERHVGNAIPPLMSQALAEHFGRLILSADA